VARGFPLQTRANYWICLTFATWHQCCSREESEKGSPMQDAVAVMLIIVIVPICSIVALRALAKQKRHRKPIQDTQ